MRIGTGFDVHRLHSGRRLIIGGVNIPFAKGLEGYSDADVLVHAICDALLGAAALGDIGWYFPDSNPAYKNISSLVLLAEVGRKLTANNFKIINIDSTIVAQQPRMAVYIPVMRENIARVLNITLEQVNIKATTTEGLGFEGGLDGISAHAVALIDNV